MSKLTDVKEILNALQVPAKQQNGMCCCVLLAMAGLTEETLQNIFQNFCIGK